MLSKTSFGIAAAGAGICLIGYCIYFDKKRRSDPDYKQKVIERRRKADTKQTSRGSVSTTKFPDPTNQEACQQYFMQEIQIGEMLLSQGQLEQGVEHLANAVVVCGQPQHLMQVFTQTLPPEVVQLLALKIPIVRQRMMEAHSTTLGTQEEKRDSGPKLTLAEDDVE